MNTQIKFTTPEEAVKVIKSGDHVHLSSVASAPQCLINAMCARGEAGELKDRVPYEDLVTTEFAEKAAD